jgi:transposase-like protein
MTKTQVEVITSVQRRRRWPISEKERIVAAALEPGAVAVVTITAAQLGYLLEGIDWRLPQHTWRPQAAG